MEESTSFGPTRVRTRRSFDSTTTATGCGVGSVVQSTWTSGNAGTCGAPSPASSNAWSSAAPVTSPTSGASALGVSTPRCWIGAGET